MRRDIHERKERDSVADSRKQQAIETKNKLLKAEELVFPEHGFQNTTVRLT